MEKSPRLAAIRIACLVLAMTAHASAAITYIDASHGVSGNTFNLDGSTFNPTHQGDDLFNSTDNLWAERAAAGRGNNDQLYTANDNGIENAPMLQTVISGLTAGATYDVYTYFWSNTTTQNWKIKTTIDPGDILGPAGSESLPTDPSVTFSRIEVVGSTTAAPAADAGDFDAAVVVTATNQALLQASLGQAVADLLGQISVYIDDYTSTNTGGLNRTWYDGVGYEFVSGPSGGNEIPAPAALPAAVAMITALAVRRRRR